MFSLLRRKYPDFGGHFLFVLFISYLRTSFEE